MLGNTLGVKDGEKFSAIDRDAFGELKPGEKPNLAVNFFTGKPEVEGLGYSFLFRNYRADLGKWQTTDPLGYPDGWNNLAYVNNQPLIDFDPRGLCSYLSIYGSIEPYNWNEPKPTDLSRILPCHYELKEDEKTHDTITSLDFTISCGTKDFVCHVANYYIQGTLVNFNPTVSYDCKKDVETHDGSVVVNYTYHLDYVVDKKVYDCGQVVTENKRFVGMSNIKQTKYEVKACSE